MRIALIAIGSTGDVEPMARLGRELMRRGHAVTLFAFSSLEPLATRAGLLFRALPGDAAKYIGSIIRPGANPFTYLSRLVEALRETLDPMLDGILNAFIGADAVVCTFFGSTPYAIAEKTGVPLLQINFSPIDPTGCYTIPVMRGLRLGAGVNRGLYHLAFRMVAEIERRYAHPWCERNGLAKRSGGSRPDHRVGEKKIPVLYAFSEHIVPRAPEWGENILQTGFFDEEAGFFSPPEALETFLGEGDKPLYIGFGSMASGDAAASLRAVLYALSRTGLRAVLAPGWSGVEGTGLPPNVYCQNEFVPHGWLFERVQGVVHHGGAGTTAAGLSAGAPTLVVPFGGDQFFWGERVSALGCGPKPLPRARLTGQALAKKLDALTANNAYRESAKRIGKALRGENGLNQAAEMVERACALRSTCAIVAQKEVLF